MPPLRIETLQSLRDFVDREIAVTDWFPLTQERIQGFADVTEDHQWIHVDLERAQRESPYGTTIAHGFLTLSLLSQFMKQAIQIQGGIRMVVNYGLNRVRFPAAVCSGTKVRARIRLQSLKDLAGCVEAVFPVTIESQNTDKPCCVAEWVLRYYS